MLPILIRWLERKIENRSMVDTTPFIPAEQFEWAPELERNWREIRAELDAILARPAEVPNFQDISADQRRLTTDDRWKTFFLKAYGFPMKRNRGRCPRTVEALRRIPGVTTAFFSILGPGKRIPEHRGPYRGVVRYHLGLKIPRPETSCGISVGGQTAHWREGSGLFFDDTYPHEAWNSTDDDRAVLFLDVVRPMRFPYSWLNQLVIRAIGRSRFVREVRLNQAAWDRELDSGMRAASGGPS